MSGRNFIVYFVIQLICFKHRVSNLTIKSGKVFQKIWYKELLCKLITNDIVYAIRQSF